MKKLIIKFSLLAILSSNSLAFSTIVETKTQITTAKLTIILNEKLLSGYKIKINYENGKGKGLAVMTCSDIMCTLSSNNLPADIISSFDKIGIYNEQDILQEISLPPYTKISNSGAFLPDTALLGSGENEWACTKDNKTGLIWEIKTLDGLRDKKKFYSNFFWNDSNNFNSNEANYGLYNNSDVFIKSVNKQSLCGFTNWRLPTMNELKSLVACSNGEYKSSSGSCTKLTSISNSNSIINSNINSTYFPNTLRYDYWSSTNYELSNSMAKYVDFKYGLSGSKGKKSNSLIRLVH
jgi:hypothetical protein